MMRRAEKVGDVAEEGQEVGAFFFGDEDAEFREAEPHWVAAEEGDGMYRIKVTNGNADLLDVEVFGTALGKLQDSLADRSMEETNSDGGCMTLASWLN